MGCCLGFCGRGVLCVGGLAVLFGFSCGLGFVVRMLGVWCWCWVGCFDGGGVRVFNVCVARACVCLRICGGWCALAAVAVLVGVAGRKVDTAEPVFMSRALDHISWSSDFLLGVGPAMRVV